LNSEHSVAVHTTQPTDMDPQHDAMKCRIPQPYQPPPSIQTAKVVLRYVNKLLAPAAHEIDQLAGENVLRKRMLMVRDMLVSFTHPVPQKREGWMAASEAASQLHERSKKQARSIRDWARKIIDDPTDLPIIWNASWATTVCLLSSSGQKRRRLPTGLCERCRIK
jgi:hypothetical protein